MYNFSLSNPPRLENTLISPIGPVLVSFENSNGPEVLVKSVQIRHESDTNTTEVEISPSAPSTFEWLTALMGHIETDAPEEGVSEASYLTEAMSQLKSARVAHVKYLKAKALNDKKKAQQAREERRKKSNALVIEAVQKLAACLREEYIDTLEVTLTHTNEDITLEVETDFESIDLWHALRRQELVAVLTQYDRVVRSTSDTSSVAVPADLEKLDALIEFRRSVVAMVRRAKSQE